MCTAAAAAPGSQLGPLAGTTPTRDNRLPLPLLDLAGTTFPTRRRQTLPIPCCPPLAKKSMVTTTRTWRTHVRMLMTNFWKTRRWCLSTVMFPSVALADSTNNDMKTHAMLRPTMGDTYRTFRRPPGGAARPLDSAPKWISPCARWRAWEAPSGKAHATPVSASRGCDGEFGTGTLLDATLASRTENKTMVATVPRTQCPILILSPSPNVRVFLEPTPPAPSPEATAVETILCPLALETDSCDFLVQPPRLAAPRFLVFMLEPLLTMGLTGWILAVTIDSIGVTTSERPLSARDCTATRVTFLHPFASRMCRALACAVSAPASKGSAARSDPVAIAPLAVKMPVIIAPMSI